MLSWFFFFFFFQLSDHLGTLGVNYSVLYFFWSNGKFGACFQPALCKQSDLLVYAARPGLRLWRTDVRGRVQETHVLKPLFNQDVPQFELFPRSSPSGAYRPTDRQLGLVTCFLKDGWVLSWNEYSVYIVDCTNQVQSVCSLQNSSDFSALSISHPGQNSSPVKYGVIQSTAPGAVTTSELPYTVLFSFQTNYTSGF